MPIELAIDVRVFDPEIGAQVENARAGGKKRLREFGSQAMRESEKDNPTRRCAICLASESVNCKSAAVLS